jgi:hypothetical protein
VTVASGKSPSGFPIVYRLLPRDGIIFKDLQITRMITKGDPQEVIDWIPDTIAEKAWRPYLYNGNNSPTANEIPINKLAGNYFRIFYSNLFAATSNKTNSSQRQGLPPPKEYFVSPSPIQKDFFRDLQSPPYAKRETISGSKVHGKTGRRSINRGDLSLWFYLLLKGLIYRLPVASRHKIPNIKPYKWWRPNYYYYYNINSNRQSNLFNLTSQTETKSWRETWLLHLLSTFRKYKQFLKKFHLANQHYPKTMLGRDFKQRIDRGHRFYSILDLTGGAAGSPDNLKDCPRIFSYGRYSTSIFSNLLLLSRRYRLVSRLLFTQLSAHRFAAHSEFHTLQERQMARNKVSSRKRQNQPRTTSLLRSQHVACPWHEKNVSLPSDLRFFQKRTGVVQAPSIYKIKIKMDELVRASVGQDKKQNKSGADVKTRQIKKRLTTDCVLTQTFPVQLNKIKVRTSSMDKFKNSMRQKILELLDKVIEKRNFLFFLNNEGIVRTPWSLVLSSRGAQQKGLFLKKIGHLPRTNNLLFYSPLAVNNKLDRLTDLSNCPSKYFSGFFTLREDSDLYLVKIPVDLSTDPEKYKKNIYFTKLFLRLQYAALIQENWPIFLAGDSLANKIFVISSLLISGFTVKPLVKNQFSWYDLFDYFNAEHYSIGESLNFFQDLSGYTYIYDPAIFMSDFYEIYLDSYDFIDQHNLGWDNPIINEVNYGVTDLELELSNALRFDKDGIQLINNWRDYYYYDLEYLQFPFMTHAAQNLSIPSLFFGQRKKDAHEKSQDYFFQSFWMATRANTDEFTMQYAISDSRKAITNAFPPLFNEKKIPANLLRWQTPIGRQRGRFSPVSRTNIMMSRSSPRIGGIIDEYTIATALSSRILSNPYVNLFHINKDRFRKFEEFFAFAERLIYPYNLQLHGWYNSYTITFDFLLDFIFPTAGRSTAWLSPWRSHLQYKKKIRSL